jgi:putative DNA methylase
VTLIRPADTDPSYDVAADEHTSAWEVLHHLIRLLTTVGLGAAGELVAKASARAEGPVDPDLVKELAFLLFAIAEKNSWTADALAFNTLATAWPDAVAAARSVPKPSGPTQAAFDFAEER